jgi:aldehyde dehydrogenase (NAD+)
MNHFEGIAERRKTLIRLQKEIILRENQILAALYADFKKPKFEGVVTEIDFVLSELRYAIKHINRWAQPEKVSQSLKNFPSTSYIIKEPYGKVLIIAPWNYPFHLAILPLISAYAAGNQVVLKPSDLTTQTSAIISQIVSTVFSKSQVEVVDGGVEVSTALLEKRWDYIFFTGSVNVGKIVAKAAANHLTPVTLELGGKCPCIIDETASVALAARRIAWGKFLNAGQTCVAPDFLLVHASIKANLIECLQKEITAMYGENPKSSPDLARIINQKNWLRLTCLLEDQKLLVGGTSDEKELYLAPTLVDEPDLESRLMQDEIFGPILPIISYQNESEIDQIIMKYEKPLALYVFSTTESFVNKCLSKYSFGGGCVNDIAVHLACKNLPFGGVGHSGMGAYHGQTGFATFTHQKSIVKKANWLDIPARYPPFGNKIKWVKKVLKWL